MGYQLGFCGTRGQDSWGPHCIVVLERRDVALDAQ
jgi:hypothetical protein